MTDIISRFFSLTTQITDKNKWILASLFFLSALANANELKEFEQVKWYEYKNAQANIELKFPYHWEPQKSSNPTELLNVHGALPLPGLRVIKREELWYLPLRFSLPAVSRTLGEQVELVESRSVTLADGTSAYLGKAHWTFALGSNR